MKTGGPVSAAVGADRSCQFCQFVRKQGRRFRDGKRCHCEFRSPDANVGCYDPVEWEIAPKSPCQNRRPPRKPCQILPNGGSVGRELLVSSASDPCSHYDPQNRHTGHRRSSTEAVFVGDRAMHVALFTKLPTKGGIVSRAPIPRRYPIDSGCAAALGFI